MSRIEMMKATVKLAKKDPWFTIKEGFTVAHLESMLERVLKDPTMDDGKVGTWLGWMQCVVCSHSPKEYSMSYFRKLNRRIKKKGRQNG